MINHLPNKTITELKAAPILNDLGLQIAHGKINIGKTTETYAKLVTKDTKLPVGIAGDQYVSVSAIGKNTSDASHNLINKINEKPLIIDANGKRDILKAPNFEIIG